MGLETACALEIARTLLGRPRIALPVPEPLSPIRVQYGNL